ncbi:MAG: ABC-type multidrug transport system ATPase subunit [Paraglaciecola sp.]
MLDWSNGINKSFYRIFRAPKKNYMTISLENVSKRYRFEWILKKIDYQFSKGNAYAITGPNGSGKSTFLKILSGHLTPSKGEIQYAFNNQKVSVDNVFKKLSFAGPYIDLIEEFTLWEAIEFHQKFKPALNGLQPQDLLDILKFPKAKNKDVRHFSSGMKQRLKLALALTSDTPLLFLDEPTTNLDRQGMEWYQGLVEQFRGDRLTIVASNIEEDFHFCNEQISILDYK